MFDREATISVRYREEGFTAGAGHGGRRQLVVQEPERQRGDAEDQILLPADMLVKAGRRYTETSRQSCEREGGETVSIHDGRRGLRDDFGTEAFSRHFRS